MTIAYAIHNINTWTVFEIYNPQMSVIDARNQLTNTDVQFQDGVPDLATSRVSCDMICENHMTSHCSRPETLCAYGGGGGMGKGDDGSMRIRGAGGAGEG